MHACAAADAAPGMCHPRAGPQTPPASATRRRGWALAAPLGSCTGASSQKTPGQHAGTGTSVARPTQCLRARAVRHATLCTSASQAPAGPIALTPFTAAVAARLPRSASRSAGHQRRTDSSGVVANCAHMSSGLTHATAQARAPCGARYGVRRVRVDQQQLGVQHGRRDQRGGPNPNPAGRAMTSAVSTSTSSSLGSSMDVANSAAATLRGGRCTRPCGARRVQTTCS